MGELKKKDILKSIRGSQGGYQLAKTPKLIMVSEIIQALDGKNQLSEGYCGDDVLRSFWNKIEKDSENLCNVSIETLVKQKKQADNYLTFNI